MQKAFHQWDAFLRTILYNEKKLDFLLSYFIFLRNFYVRKNF